LTTEPTVARIPANGEQLTGGSLETLVEGFGLRPSHL